MITPKEAQKLRGMIQAVCVAEIDLTAAYENRPSVVEETEQRERLRAELFAFIRSLTAPKAPGLMLPRRGSPLAVRAARDFAVAAGDEVATKLLSDLLARVEALSKEAREKKKRA